MKKLILSLVASTAFIFGAAAQVSCGATPARLSGNAANPTAISLTATTPAVTITTSSTLPNVEYLITNQNQMSSDTTGPAIVGSSFTGMVRADSFGIGTCETFAIVPIAYNLSQLRVITQTLLTGDYQTGVTCCDFVGNFFPDFCQTLNDAGINDSTDINSITDFLNLAGVLLGAGNNLSVSSATTTIDFLNGAIGFMGACNGGVTEVCYAVDTTGSDYYIVSGALASSFTISPDTATIIGLGNTYQFSANFAPSGSCPQSLFWQVVGGSSNVAINSSTGQATGNGFDTVLVAAVSFQDTTMRDTAVLIVRDVQASVHGFDAEQLAARLFPNPTSGNFTLFFSHEERRQDADYQIVISNINGQKVWQQNVVAAAGEQSINIDIEHLSAGVYVFELRHARGSYIQKLVKN